MVDQDPEAKETANRNMPKIPFWCADISHVSGSELLERAGLKPEDELHVLVGGPPCQGFSYAGKRALEDERNALMLDFLRLVKETRPMCALIENVNVILTAYEGQFINDICDRFKALGYSSIADTLIASDFGVPQLRKRAFIMAYRADIGKPRFPERTHERIPFASELIEAEKKNRLEENKLPYVSVEEAIGDLPPIRSGGGDDMMFYSMPPQSDFQKWARTGSIAAFNHRARSHGEKYLKKIAVIKEGQRNATLNDAERFSDNYFSQAYARLHRKGIAQTITTHFGNPGSGRYMHYQELRSITVREAARFQSFPDSYIFYGVHSSQGRHVGNAVPPLLAKALATQILSDLTAAGVGKNNSIGTNKSPIPPIPIPAETPEAQRARIMRSVHSKNTTPELIVKKAFRKAGIKGFRRNMRTLSGNPDFVFPTERLILFVDGCFWHGCETCYREPKSNQEYWKLKVERNRKRDKTVVQALTAQGWRVLRIWEHEVANLGGDVIKKVTDLLSEKSSTLKNNIKRRQRIK
jgi:DNA (cytosine-5)-methyltransferase 1